MSQTALWDELQSVFRDVFDDAKLCISREMTAADVEGWDSIKNLQLMVAVEAAFDVHINTGEIAGLGNVGELFDIVSKRAPRVHNQQP